MNGYYFLMITLGSLSDPQILVSLIASFTALLIAVANGIFALWLRRRDQKRHDEQQAREQLQEDLARVRLVSLVLAVDTAEPSKSVIYVNNYSGQAVLSLTAGLVPASAGSVTSYQYDPMSSLGVDGYNDMTFTGDKIRILPAGDSALFLTDLDQFPSPGDNCVPVIEFTLPSGRRYRTSGGTPQRVEKGKSSPPRKTILNFFTKTWFPSQ